MFERFTDEARKVIAYANQEAQRFNHEYIGTEHLLLGLVKEGSGVGATVLKNLDMDIKKLRLEVEKLVTSGPDMVIMGKLPNTPRAKKVVEYAIEEAGALNHEWVCTGHLLLGLLRETEGVHYQMFKNLGLIGENVRQKVLEMIAGKPVEKFETPTWEKKPPKKKQRPWKSTVPLTLLIDPGDCTAEELSELFVELSTLYRMVGGSGVNFTIVDAKEPAIA
jgi:ATP-dependent Clp protease ATP-binding subunit ClpC